MGDLDSAFKQVLQGQSQVLAFKGEYLQATQEVMRGASVGRSRRRAWHLDAD